MSKSSTPKNSSKPLSPGEVTGYFNALDTLTGGSHVAPTTTQVWVPDPGAQNPGSYLYSGDGEQQPAGHYETRTTPGSDSAGRLSTFAQTGTPAVQYEGAGSRTYLGDQSARIKALGGLGATQTAEVQRARAAALQQINADAGLDVTQKARSRQLSDNDYADRLAAIAKQSEGAIAQAGLATAQADQQAALAEARQKYAADVRNADLSKEDLKALASIFFGGSGNTQSGGGTSSSVDAAKVAEVALAAAAFFSSAALKDDIEALPADDAVLALQPVSYRWRPGTEGMRAGHDGIGFDVGLIAEQVAEMVPALAARDADGQVIGVRYHLLPVLLLTQVQAQQAEIAALRADLAEMRAQMGSAT